MKPYEGVSECHSLSSLCDRFAWKIKVSLLNFTQKGKYGENSTKVLTLGKLTLTNVLNYLLLWHSFFDTRQANSYVQMNPHRWPASPSAFTVLDQGHTYTNAWWEVYRCSWPKIRELKQRWRRRQRERQESDRYKLAKQPFCTCITLFWSNG